MSDKILEDKKEENKQGRKPAEVYSEKAETKAPELDSDEMKALALAYAKYLKEKGLAPGEATFVESEDLGVNAGGKKNAEISVPAPEEKAPAEENAGTGNEDLKKLAAEYARQLKEAGLRPGETAKPEPEEEKPAGKKLTVPEIEKVLVYKREEAEKKKKKKKKAASKTKRKRPAAKPEAGKKKTDGGAGGSRNILVSWMDAHDRLQDSLDESLTKAGKAFIAWAHKVAYAYSNSYKTIGIGVFIVGLFAAGILIVFDSVTVYEYAYNGKVLGYVKEQEEVTEVLDVAGSKLSQNNGEAADVEFVANQNVTFNPVDGRGRSTDDMDTAINKLIYMTDIETEAYAVVESDSEGSRIVAIVKDSDAADRLLEDSLAELSTPDSGMELVSAEFMKDLSTRPINVLLSSVQSSNQADILMTKGGDMETFHIVEEGETIGSISEEFGVDAENIYDENNREVVNEIAQGDKICIRSTVEPVNVRMVETGKMKETIEYETIKKKSGDYYQGDTHLEQEGHNGTQIFEGTLTKVNGEVVDRDEISTTVTKEKQDKIILIGTKERPKTAPTGTYALPIQRYTVTSEWGGRWGRMHDGIDLGASTGTPIYATDGGTVIRADWYSGYGLCVDIDHENGRMTRYGHCSQLLVSAGDKVYQGQEIALVGNTGNSFGSHLHFEIRLDGASVNPRKYVQF